VTSPERPRCRTSSTSARCSERTYRLRLTEHNTVDAQEFERAAVAALAAGAESRRSALVAAAGLWTGVPSRSVAQQLVELDPLSEVAHRRLIVAFARTGRRGHALRQFVECRRVLVTELGVEPGQETAALQRRVLAGERV
jgi:DNA-binding SARP family transcriptional activator